MYNLFVGVDISCDCLDFYLLYSKDNKKFLKINNCIDDITLFLKAIRAFLKML